MVIKLRKQKAALRNQEYSLLSLRSIGGWNGTLVWYKMGVRFFWGIGLEKLETLLRQLCKMFETLKTQAKASGNSSAGALPASPWSARAKDRANFEYRIAVRLGLKGLELQMAVVLQEVARVRPTQELSVPWVHGDSHGSFTMPR